MPDAMIRSGRLQHAIVVALVIQLAHGTGFMACNCYANTMKPFDRERNGLSWAKRVRLWCWVLKRPRHDAFA